MTFTECCKNCKHCIPGRSSNHGWCLLRKIKLHPEIIHFAFCHRWNKRDPSLPIIQENYVYADEQLDFSKSFANLEN